MTQYLILTRTMARQTLKWQIRYCLQFGKTQEIPRNGKFPRNPGYNIRPNNKFRFEERHEISEKMTENGVKPGTRVKRGSWIEERTLGSGGFGTVVLWRNEDSGDAVAIKRCRLQSEMTPKHRHRWEMEVDIMKRLDHPNVIRALEVPPPLDVGPNEIPLLAMEYCSGGDLRKVLNNPENCCGLKENQIRNLLRDIASAIEYLHSKRVIHRDLKPENIVLQIEDNKIIYKLIDLGYAKELDQGSVCTSFVGTLQYLAPELFASQKYSSSVDYWSFGVVVFECITGYRPFLPTLPPIQWHGEIQKKTNEHICAFFTAAGTVEFSKKIPAPNHLCRTTQLYIEQFLRVILVWDPKNRGGGIEKESKRPKCFVLLDNIFKMKVIHFLCVTTNQLLSYPVTENHKLLDVMNVIEQETRIPVAEQEILFASGIVPDIHQPAVQCWDEQGEDESIVFLFHKKITDFSNSSSSTTRRKAKPIPDLVQVMIAEPKTLMPYQDQKKTWGHAVYFCMEQAKDYKRLLQAQRAAMLNLLRNNSIFTKLKTQMTTEITKLMAKIDFSKESITQDIERYEEQEKSGGLSSEKLKKSWTMMKEEIMKYTKLQQQVNDLEVHTQGLQTKIVELQRSPYARTKQTDTLGEIEAAAMKLYQELRQMAREKRQQISDNTGMVQAVVRCYTQRDKLTGDLYQHISKLASCKLDMSDLLPRVQETIDDIKAGSSVLMAYQKQRQTEMWTMLKKLVQRSQAPGSQPHSLTSSLMRSTSRQSGSSGGNSFSQMFEKNMEASSMLRTENEDSKTKLESTLSSLVLEQEEFLSADNQLQWDFLAEEEAPSIQQGADLS